MRNLDNPQQSKLFNVFQDILSSLAFKRLQGSWEQLFRLVILKLLPAPALAQHFHPIMGRPTKELYSMAGLIFMMEFRNWTQEEAVDAYSFHVNIQYAKKTKDRESAGKSRMRVADASSVRNKE